MTFEFWRGVEKFIIVNCNWLPLRQWSSICVPGLETIQWNTYSNLNRWNYIVFTVYLFWKLIIFEQNYIQIYCAKTTYFAYSTWDMLLLHSWSVIYKLHPVSAKVFMYRNVFLLCIAYYVWNNAQCFFGQPMHSVSVRLYI